MTIKISISNNYTDNFPTDYTLTIEEAKALFTTFTETGTKQTSKAFIGGHFNSKQRKTENLQSRTLLVLDLDHATVNLTELIFLMDTDLRKYTRFIYSTASHTSDKPKLRIVLILDKEVEVSAYKNMASNFINTLTNIKAYIDVNASISPCHIMLLPFKPSADYKWNYGFYAGDTLDTGLYLVDTDINKPKNTTEDSFDKLVKTSPIDITKEEVVAYLKLYELKSCSYAEWLEVGIALHHQFAGSDEGLKIWSSWSLKYKNTTDNLDTMEYKWSTFSSEGSNVKTFASIMKKVKIIKSEKVVKTITSEKEVGSVDNIPLCRSLWQHTKGKNLTPLSTSENYIIMLSYYNIKINYDEILKRININFNGKLSTDDNGAITAIKSLCELNALKTTLVSEMVTMIAYNNTINSWRDLILQHSNAKTDNFDKLCASVKVAPEYESLKRLYLKKWLLQMIHMTCLNDGASPKSARLVLIFQGNQGVGKTSWFRSLVPADKPEYIIEGRSINVSNMMDILSCISHVFVELGEVGATFRKSDMEQIKAFISTATDVLNIKYIAKPVKYRRRTVFFGSVNDKIFLQDTTGNSRFIVLPILSCDARHNINMFELYSELLEEAKRDDSYELSIDETLLQTKTNNSFEAVDSLRDKFEEVFDISTVGTQIATATKTLEMMGFNMSNIRKATANDMSRLLDGYQFKKSTKPRGWLLPALRSDTDLM